jgi:hypothetical protein
MELWLSQNIRIDPSLETPNLSPILLTMLTPWPFQTLHNIWLGRRESECGLFLEHPSNSIGTHVEHKVGG